MKDDMIRRKGTVSKVHGGTYEVIDDETQAKVLCTLNGKMKMRHDGRRLCHRPDYILIEVLGV